MTDNIILVGPMGAGKTTVGKKLAGHLNRPFVDVDESIIDHLGVSIQTIFDTEGEAGFRKRELTMLTTVLKQHQRSVIATGGGCISTPACRRLIVQQRLVVHVDVGLKQQYARLVCDKRRPILQTGNLKEKLQKLRADRHAVYVSVADLYVLTDALSFPQIAAKVLRAMQGQKMR